MDRTVLFIKTPRLECRHCEQVLNAVLPNVAPKCNYTKSFAKLVIDLRKIMTIRDVARWRSACKSDPRLPTLARMVSPDVCS